MIHDFSILQLEQFGMLTKEIVAHKDVWLNCIPTPFKFNLYDL